MEGSEWIRELTERWAAEDKALARVDEAGCWAPPGWADWTLQELFVRRRHFAGMSQSEAARRSGMDQSDISRIEHGRNPRWSTLDRLAYALDCELVVRLKPRDPNKGPAR